MIRISTTILLPVVCFTLGAFAVHAQTAPVKPGLWQFHTERETNGQKAPDTSERLKNMPPARRAQVEAMMKERGVDASGNLSEVCETAATLDSKNFVNPTPDCKTTYSTRTNTLWKSHTSCTQGHLESDAEINFPNPENFVIKIATTVQSEGRAETTHMIKTGKWLSADCGDIKPLSMKP